MSSVAETTFPSGSTITRHFAGSVTTLTEGGSPGPLRSSCPALLMVAPPNLLLALVAQLGVLVLELEQAGALLFQRRALASFLVLGALQLLLEHRPLAFQLPQLVFGLQLLLSQ